MKNEIPKWMAEEVAEYDLELTPPPATVLDIGANIGAFALYCSAKWPQAQIRCYEPVKDNCLALWDNTKKRDRVQCFFAAVRNFSGRAPIFIGERPATCGFYDLGRQTSKTEEVECLDAGDLKPADLVKIDTEGCEVEIVERLDLSKTRALVVEYHRAEDKTKIVDLCEKSGLRLLAERPGNPNHGVLKFNHDAGVTLPLAQPPAVKAEVRKIYVAIAGHFAMNDMIFVQGLMALVLRPPVMLRFGWNTDPSVERARNVLTANFLASECSHILFIDSDIGFAPSDVARITSHEELIVGGIYPLKNVEPTVKWCGNGVPDGALTQAARGDGLQEVQCVGTGFLCIARSVFERTIDVEGRRIRYVQDWPPYRDEFAFWRQEVRHVNGKARFLTEDWNFCYGWRELGGRVWADTQVVLRHAGRAEWPLPLQKGNPFATKADLPK